MRPLTHLAAALAIATALPACHDSAELPANPNDTILDGDAFVAIPRSVNAETVAQRRQTLAAAGAPTELAWTTTGGDFYLAIHKDALDDPWFLSAFLKQYLPGGVGGGAASSLGTRVVSFKIQNDRLYVFDVDNRKATSDVFDPEVLVEAYPIITGWERFEILPGHRDYVLIDPSAGLNRFGVVGDAFSAGYIGGDYQPRHFQVELSFLQNYQEVEDGITYEQVFSGYADQPLPDPIGGIEESYFRGSGTLGIALRRYREGANYTEVEMPGQEHYFRSQPRVVRNQGTADSVAAHWDLYPGMTPIQWHISDALVQYDASKPGIDLVAAVRTGIESWNEALGFTAFETVLASPGDSFADDTKNFVIFDPDPSLGYAFANWRSNPNTGEIRGASIYFGAGWIIDDYFPPEEVTADSDPEGLVPAKKPHPVPSLVWDSMRADHLCVYWAPTYRAQASAPETALSNKDIVELYLTNMVVHEIGHTLGLRHNFKGSNLPPSSTVMDYNNFDDSLAQPLPGSYDVAAVQYLYGLSSDLPTEPFCTDGEYYFDPDCGVFDTGAEPLVDFHIPEFQTVETYFLDYGFPLEYVGLYMDYYAQGMLGYVRAGQPAAAQLAWDTAMARVGAPIDPALLASAPWYGEAADALNTWVLSSLFLTDEATRGYISNDPADDAIVAQIVGQAGQVLANTDGVRSFASRRQMVDLLEKVQRTDAYLALLEGRAAIEAQLADPANTAADAALLADLIARIDAATQPYFD